MVQFSEEYEPENFEMLNPRARRMIVKMLRIRGIEDPTEEQKYEEAYWFRVRSGWFVWDCPSTAKRCRKRKRDLAIPEYEIPVMPDL